jgi:glyoxylase-like metal-dependent hydrolase (beta-lactamase superfamily II)
MPVMGAAIEGISLVRVGDLTITKVEEQAPVIPIDLLIPSATGEPLWAERPYLHPDQLGDDDTFSLSISGYLIDGPGWRVLVDTCIGTENQYGDPASPFLNRLVAHGIATDSVDAVICTHAHLDHVGWNTVVHDGQRSPTFGRARYLLSDDEWESSRSGDASSSGNGDRAHITSSVTPIVEAGVADLVSGEHRVNDEIVLVPTPGHSPGHLSVFIESQGHRAVVTGDLVHHPVQFTHTDWYSDPDEDRGQATATRQDFLDRVTDEDVLVIGSHFAGAWHGHVRQIAGSPRFVPLAGR